ncbi:hypothetical protein [Calothrix sp. 336/3]|uniref:hypothetical protein n=1 Tax=Calothrix sp. 336/3 TaxID=1337936 RepID=UPI0004E28F37|nr:hypothetical protein [Calothrix sp. 336/3]AKG21260.1 hypothetical protein IJ00_08075 [Calothrix sp. 336/3]
MNVRNEILIADEAQSLETAGVVRDYDTWNLVNGHGWEDTKKEAVNSTNLYLARLDEGLQSQGTSE